MIYDLKERQFLLKKIYRLESISAVQSAYRVQYNTKTASSHPVIYNIVKQFEKTGSVVHKRQQKSSYESEATSRQK